ncbi:hypothetical protein BE08_04995 [Sorangium cellulosum]|uniref:DNA-binding domain-containing protein n=1 Tax=Sorangium cellulosum TaxID=56 RepID=A0A150PJF7_SORCE|nr:hypothetical protein BE08_04995 [Sorangium cellulosum]
MSVAEMQACLARLYVDEPYRKLFYLDAATTLEEYRLTPEERAALQGLDRERLEFFASSLRSKRKKRLERAFPMLFALDPAEVNRYYARYYQLYTAKARQSGHDDAMDFGAFMAESLAGADHLPPFASDLARYEMLYYGATFAAGSFAGAEEAPGEDGAVGPSSRPGMRAGVQLARFAYDMVAIEEALQRGMKPEDIESRPQETFILFRPAAARAEVGMLRVNGPTKVVLDLCDGRRTVAAIVAETEAILRAGELEGRVLATIRRLLEARILTLDPGATRAASAQQQAYGAAQAEAM